MLPNKLGISFLALDIMFLLIKIKGAYRQTGPKAHFPINAFVY
jgi:hypothetical protein